LKDKLIKVRKKGRNKGNLSMRNFTKRKSGLVKAKQTMSPKARNKKVSFFDQLRVDGKRSKSLIKKKTREKKNYYIKEFEEKILAPLDSKDGTLVKAQTIKNLNEINALKEIPLELFQRPEEVEMPKFSIFPYKFRKKIEKEDSSLGLR
jgi:hypothetical protein